MTDPGKRKSPADAGTNDEAQEKVVLQAHDTAKRIKLALGAFSNDT